MFLAKGGLPVPQYLGESCNDKSVAVCAVTAGISFSNPSLSQLWSCKR